MKNEDVNEAESHRIHPHEIAHFPSRAFKTAFQDDTDGFCAWMITRFCKSHMKNAWGPISMSKIRDWSDPETIGEQIVERLRNKGYIADGPDDTFNLTRTFTDICASMVPKP